MNLKFGQLIINDLQNLKFQGFNARIFREFRPILQCCRRQLLQRPAVRVVTTDVQPRTPGPESS